jgi:hypothetical protein
LLIVLSALVLCAAGCWDAEEPPAGKGRKESRSGPIIEGRKVDVGQNVWIEMMPDKSRRVLIGAEVCLRRGMLELVLTRKGKKTHEAIFAAQIDARKVHEALLLAGARPGKPAEFVPKYVLATGSPVSVDVLYTDESGKRRMVPAGSWVRDTKTGQELDTTWVFAGSQLVADHLSPNGPKVYLANEGDVITVANMEYAVLDVPFMSSKADDDRNFEAWEERIPPIGTKVYLVLTPVKKGK